MAGAGVAPATPAGANELNARIILTALAVLFGVLSLMRVVRGGTGLDPMARTWLMIALTFSLVSLWLWFA
jgi:hypothetical protein